MIIDGFVGEIWSVKKKKKCVSLRIQRRRVEVGLIYDVLTWCMLMTLSSYLFSNTGKSVINLSLNFTTMLYINIDRFVYRMCDASDTSFLRNFLTVYRAKCYRITSNSNNFRLFKFRRFENFSTRRGAKEGKKIWFLLLISRKKKKRKKKEFRIHCCSGIALGKGRRSFKVGERLYHTDSILPILHSSIHYKFPDSCSSSDKTRWKSRNIYNAIRSLTILVNVELSFDRIVAYFTNSYISKRSRRNDNVRKLTLVWIVKRKISLLPWSGTINRDTERKTKMRDRWNAISFDNEIEVARDWSKSFVSMLY